MTDGIPPAHDELAGFSPAKTLPHVSNVSWPRSGHGLLKRLLDGTFGVFFGYCEYYGPSRKQHLACCNAFPCRRADIHMSKQHDFGSKAVLDEDAPLIVQYRDFPPSVVSNFELAIGSVGVENTAESFRRFAFRRANDYRIFTEKWLTKPRQNRVCLPYEDLTRDPKTGLEKVLHLYGAPEFLPLAERVIDRVAHLTFQEGKLVRSGERGIRPTRVITAFRFYDRGLFAELTERTALSGSAASS